MKNGHHIPGVSEPAGVFESFESEVQAVKDSPVDFFSTAAYGDLVCMNDFLDWQLSAKSDPENWARHLEGLTDPNTSPIIPLAKIMERLSL